MTGHLEYSLEFLHAVRNAQFSCFFIEIPLGSRLAGTLKTFVSDRTHNAAGHVQFFTTGSVHRFLVSGGFVILNTGKNVPAL